MNYINTWQFNLFWMMFFSVLFNQFYKLAAEKLKNDGAGTIIVQSIAGLSVLLLIPLFPLKLSHDWRIYLFLGIACIFYAINDRLQTTVRKNLEVSVSTIVNKLSSVFLIIIGLVFFKEPFTITKILGALLILVSTVVLRYKKGKFTLNKYVVLASASCLALAIASSIDVGISRNFNLPIYIMMTFMVPTFIIKTVGKITFKEVKNEYQNGIKKYFFLTGICWGLMVIFMIRAYQFASFSLITPLSTASVLINVLIATIFFGERKDIFKKIVASLITIVGVYLTVLR